ncbi:hypothetical protein JMX53_09495 [Cutibacterium avidum]|nr:hypothetical protein JMX53_09495 [Cutibacterium avidum]
MAAELDVAAAAVIVTVHVSAGLTASAHELFAVGQVSVGAGGADNVTKYSTAWLAHGPSNIESFARARNQAWSLSVSRAVGGCQEVCV